MQRDVATALARIVDHGWRERDGLWERLFREDAIPMRGDHLVVWTGWLVRPAADTCLLVSGAYNRRSRVALREHLLEQAIVRSECLLEATWDGHVITNVR